MASYGPHGRLLCPRVYQDSNTDQPMGRGAEGSTKKSRHEGGASRPLLAWPDLEKTIYTELPTAYSGGGRGGLGCYIRCLPSAGSQVLLPIQRDFMVR